jgi:DnaA family protein
MRCRTIATVNSTVALRMTNKDIAHRQLTLNVQLRDKATLDNFYCAQSSLQMVATLRSQLDSAGERFVYVFGSQDSGKSHLLQGACHLAGSSSLYLPLGELAGFDPEEVLQGVEGMALVCLDDINAVLGNDQWELALFDFFNRARDADCRLLFSAPAAPRVVQVVLPDLRSRLSWASVYQLQLADDEAKQEIFCFRAERRGLQVPAEVARYIVSRAPRALSALLALLEQLDAASLAEKRPLSIPFVKQQLGW